MYNSAINGIISEEDWKYTSHDSQYEMLKTTALSLLRKIAINLRTTESYTIMVDECTNVLNHEQVSLLF